MKNYRCSCLYGIFFTLKEVCCFCLTVAPPQNDAQAPAPSSSSHTPAPAPANSSRYRERRSRRMHRNGGTRDDRYRSGQETVSLIFNLLLKLWAPLMSLHQPVLMSELVFKITLWAVSKGPIKQGLIRSVFVYGSVRRLEKPSAVEGCSWGTPLWGPPLSVIWCHWLDVCDGT